MAWTDDRVERLRKMWADGNSASQIANALGGVTRNAVIGKVHRLGLSGRDRTGTGAAARKAATPKPRAKPRTPRAPKPISRPAAAVARKTAPESKPPVEPASRARPAPSAPRIPDAVRAMANRPFEAPREGVKMANGEYATVMTITDHMCKWPIGDPSTEEFRFCARRTEPEEPYCTAHSRVAYQPSRRRASSTTALPPITRRKAIR